MTLVKTPRGALAALLLFFVGAAPPALAQAVAPTGLTRPKPFVWCDSSLPPTASNWSQCIPTAAPGADFSVLNDTSGRDIYGKSGGVPGKIVKDIGALVRLGKALFWEQDVGSDGNACASCHFHAGADTRLKNQLSPGFKDVNFGPGGNTKFGSQRSDTGQVALGNMPSGALADSNYTLRLADFPLHRLQNEADRDSPIVTTTDDRVASQGAFDTLFTKVKRRGDKCTPPDPSIFHAGLGAARQVEPRNTPSTTDTVFQQRSFWDSRANNLYNGVGVFGMRDILGDPNARLLVFEADGNPQSDFLLIEDASLASQAMGPPLSALEMSCSGRTMPEVGKKMVPISALKGQIVAPDDSVLGPVSNSGRKGLKMR